ncbi:YciI-like protein [Streptoalloteichus hindustanus]|uniref:YCII-related domain-containing protein n=1 Tax=Streptoalloteichus hindustanus TaxID=2017 RepID=A0A1M5DEN0_STRHI|nr:YciI-like protein [Streptoalloteichus hindustanus]SHF65132.1 hypothetical protein SAMN05444320_104414 [Streptoalloteichus hindustanus]
MAYFLLEYVVVEDYVQRRAEYRAEHLALARRAHERDGLVLAGALTDPVDRGVLVWSVEDPAVIERFVEQDPYVRNGLVTSWAIRPWTVVVGGDATT